MVEIKPFIRNTFRALMAVAAVGLCVGTADATALLSRSNYTLTLLPDSTIMITGGDSATGYCSGGSSIQIYDPKALPAPYSTPICFPSNIIISSHTATLLPNGKVLIAGGSDGSGNSLATAYLFNPSTKASPTTINTLTYARAEHTATLLKNGKVLIAGGITTAGKAVGDPTDDSTEKSMEIYDPSAGTFTAIGNLLTARWWHTATLLTSGYVFITGGYNPSIAIQSTNSYLGLSELFDPSSNTTSPAAPLARARAFHTATALNDGSVLVVGGYNADNSSQTQFINTFGYIDTVERYTGGQDMKTAQSLPVRLSRHSAVLTTDGAVQVYGGLGNFTTQYYNTTFTILSSTINLTADAHCAAGDCGSGTINTISKIQLNADKTLTEAVSGIIVAGEIMFGTLPSSYHNIQNTDLYLDFPNSSPGDLSSSLQNNPIYQGNMYSWPNLSFLAAGTAARFPVRSTSVSLSNSYTSCYLYFDPPTNLIDKSSATITSASTCTVSASIYVPGTDYVYDTADSLYSKLKKYYMQVVSGNSAWSISLTSSIALYFEQAAGAGDSGHGGASGLSQNILEDALGNYYFTISSQLLNGITGEISNQTGSTIASSPITLDPSGGQWSGSLELAMQYFITPVTATGNSFEASISTAIIQTTVFSDFLNYEPTQNLWVRVSTPNATFVFPRTVYNMGTYDDSTLLTPGGITFTTGGLACSGSNPSLDCSSLVKQNFVGGFDFYPTIWSNTYPKLTYARAGHTTTLLPDGRIVAIGGYNGTATVATGEYMDPLGSSPTWSLTSGTLSVSRANHTATLMPNGNLLIAGGYTQDVSSGPVTNADIFYPKSNSIVQASSMTMARQNHTAIMLPAGPSAGNIMVMGGFSTGTYTASCEIYVSTANKWMNALHPMNTKRAHHTATILQNAKILVVGGINENGELNSVELFNPLDGSWTTKTPLNHYRHDHTATLLSNGNVMVIGGNGSGGEIFDAELYNPSADTWSLVVPTNDTYASGRMNHTANLLPNGNILLVGGSTIGGTSLYKTTLYYPETASIADAPQGFNLPVARSKHTTTILSDGQVLTVGGFDGNSYLATVANSFFAPTPDGYDLPTTRKPGAVTVTASTQFNVKTSTLPYLYFDTISTVTLQSGTSTFFGVTDASDGKTGSSSHSMPRIYSYMIDTPSSYMLDLSTYIYSAYGNSVNSFANYTSSLTLVTPLMPYGWYHYRVADNGIFSDGFTICVSSPPPQGVVAFDTVLSSPTSTNNIFWKWSTSGVKYADGLNVYSSSNSVFITQLDTSQTSYTTSFGPNTPVALQINTYNITATGDMAQSPTFYTYAATPTSLTVGTASFTTASLVWSANNNPPWTAYEVDISTNGCDSLSHITGPCANSTINPHSMWFDSAASSATISSVISTNTFTISGLTAGTTWYFRVRARNGDVTSLLPPLDGKDYSTTAFCCTDPTDSTNSLYISTKTVGTVANIYASTITANSITWTWDAVTGNSVKYVIYSSTGVVRSTSDAHAFDTTFTYGGAGETSLIPNTSYYISIQASDGGVLGNMATAPTTYTMANQPLANSLCALTSTPSWVTVTTGTITGQWAVNSNPLGTSYLLEISTCNFATRTSCYYTLKNVQNTTVTPCLSASFGSLYPDQAYQMRVSAINSSQYTLYSATTSLTTGTTGIYTLALPPDTTTFSATNITASSATLVWDNPNLPATPVFRIIASTQSSITGFYDALPFISTYTATSYSYKGLLSGTTYWLNIQTRNGDTIVTSTVSLTNNADGYFVTTAGPGGIPPGAIVGYASDGIITGSFPDGRVITVTVPGNAYADPTTQIGIAEMGTDPCAPISDICNGNNTACPTFGIFTSNDAILPLESLKISFNYRTAELSGLNKSKLVLARDNGSGSCLGVQTTVDVTNQAISATFSHTSASHQFQLIQVASPTDLNTVLIYPNPLYPNRRGNGYVTFDNLPVPATVRLYTLSGEKVWEGNKATVSPLIWDGKNSSGESVASGIYLAVIDSSVGKKTFKLAVER